VNGRPFFNVASIGFGVGLTRALTRASKWRWGVLGYAITAIRALDRFHPVTIERDGRPQQFRTVHVAVGNGRHYGGGMIVSENARIDDGRLGIYSLEVRSFWRMLLLLPALRSGRHHAWAEIRTLAGQKFELRTRRPPLRQHGWKDDPHSGPVPCTARRVERLCNGMMIQ
jgi:diacylglycerol kinase (ATP)